MLCHRQNREAEADNYMRYLKTRFVRFLISILAMTQHISKGMFGFVPQRDTFLNKLLSAAAFPLSRECGIVRSCRAVLRVLLSNMK